MPFTHSTNCTWAHRNHLRTAWREWIPDLLDPKYFIVLATNDPDISKSTLRQQLHLWSNKMNRAVVGPRWHQNGLENQNKWVAGAEHLSSNPHWHVLFRPADLGKTPEEVELSAWECWMGKSSIRIEENDESRDINAHRMERAKNVRRTFFFRAVDDMARDISYVTKDIGNRCADHTLMG